MNYNRKDLLKLFPDDNYKLEKIIQNNNAKGSSVYKVSYDNKYYVVKVINENCLPRVKKNFLKESNFLKNNYSHLWPKYTNGFENIFQMEYLSGVSLLENLSRGSIYSDLENVFNKSIDLYNYVSKSHQTIEIKKYKFENAYKYLDILLTSGPIQMKNVKVFWIRKFINKFYSKILGIFLKIAIKKIDLSKMREGFCHGDFHYNNIMILKQGDIKFLDFENISYDGFFDFDLLYLYVMCEIFIKDKNNREMKKSIIYKICGNNKGLLMILSIYRFAIYQNKKFKNVINLSNMNFR